MSVAAQGPGLGLRLGRLCAAWGLMAGGLALAACSAETSRFDYPIFNLSRSQAPAQPVTTAALPPVPAESVYAGDARGQQARADTVERHPVAPPQSERPARHDAGEPSAAPTAPTSRSVAAAPPRPAPVPGSARPPIQAAPAVPTTVAVAAGDTLSGIASRHGVSTAALMRANDLSSDRLRVGQTLVIPDGDKAPVAHTVRGGETVYAIARTYNVDPRELARHNGLSDTVIRPGQVLAIPGGSGASVAAAREARPAPAGVRVVRTRPVQAPQRAEDKPVRAAAAGPVPMPQPSPARARASTRTASQAPVQAPTRVAALPQPGARADAAFRWPVRGRVVSGFGAKPDGRHNDGINIAVPLGTEVKAAENGVVAYAGNELEGYGNLILIRHADNWVSAYAHNDTLLVRRGEKVERGQVIARAGQSGSVNQPQLHFELRKGSKPVDPVQYLAQN